MHLSELIEKSQGDRTVVSACALPARGRAHDLEMILDIIRRINSSLVLSELLERVVDQAIRIANADRGFLMLAGTGNTLRFVMGRDAEGKAIPEEHFRVSSSVLDDVFTTGESMCVEHALGDDRFEARQSIMALELETILCSPLRTESEIIGVIYVDSKHIQAVNQAEILSVFEILAGHAAIAIRNATLYDGLKHAYGELANANDHILRLERMASKGEIAAEVSHELKNIIAVVMLSLESLQRRFEKLNPAEMKSLIETARQATKKIINFSESLLTRTRANGKLMPVNMSIVVKEFVEFVKVLPKFKHNTMNLHLDSAVPSVDLDIDQIQQVLLNLMNNAVEAFPDATLDLVTTHDAAGGRVELSVKDNGPGIDESIKEKLFHERVTTKPDGHGFGLPICRQIVEHHGGSIRIESAPGEGTAFVMTFPMTGEGGSAAKA